MNTILINFNDENQIERRKAITHIRHALTDIGYTVPQGEEISSRTIEKLKLTNKDLKIILIAEVR